MNRTIWFVGVVLAVIAIGRLIGNIQHVTNSQRLALAGESWEIFERSPLTGVGGWNFGLVYPQVSFDDHWQRHPHTFPLWVLTGFGGLGFGVVVAGGYLLYQRRLRPRYLPLIVFFTLHELVDTMLWIPAILYLLAILLPLIVSGSKEGERSRHEKVGLFPEFSVPKIVRASLLYFLTIVSGFVMWNTITFKNGIKLANAQQWEQAESRLSQSTVAFSLVHRALAQTRLDQPNKAVSLLKRARRLNQYDPYYAYLLSKLLSDLGHAGEAKRYESLRRRLDPNDVLSIADPPSEWGATFYPSEYGRVGSATLRPERVKMHPRRAGWYLPLVDERIRQSDCKTALDRIKRLEKFPEVTHFTRIQLESRRLNCYRMKGWTSRIKRSRERLKRLRNREPSVRSMYHQFFYRRTGLDHGFFKH